MNTSELKKYKKLGWEFYVDEACFSEREWAIKFKSPRLNSYTLINWSKHKNTLEELLEEVSEKELLKIETKAYAEEFYEKNEFELIEKIEKAILAGKKKIVLDIT